MSDRIIVTDATEGIPRTTPPRVSRGLALVAVVAMAWGIGSETRAGTSAEPITGFVVRPFAPPIGTWVETSFSGHGSFTDVVRRGSDLVAVGSGMLLDSPAFVWHASEGRPFVAAEGPWRAGDVITSAAAIDSGYLAAGYRITDPFASGGPATSPMIWASPNSASWELVKTAGLPAHATITRIDSAGETLVAVGWEGPGVLEPMYPPPQERAAGRVWTSDDGRIWRDVTPETDAPRFTDVVPGREGPVVSGSYGGAPAVWMSGDAWNRLVLGGESWIGHEVISIDLDDSGLIALVRDPNDVEGMISVWRIDADGTWTTLSRSAAPKSSGWMGVIDGDLFAGAGYSRSVYPAGPELWVADDGEEWFPVEVTSGPSPWPPAIVTDAIRVGGDILAVGSRGRAPTVWTLTVP